jgi:hypothetical protein
VASLEVVLLFGNLLRTYQSPEGFTSKFNEGCLDVQHMENLDLKGPILLHTLSSCGFLHIKTTTIKVSLIKLLHTNNFGSDEFQIELGSQGFGAYTGKLRGRFILKLEK